MVHYMDAQAEGRTDPDSNGPGVHARASRCGDILYRIRRNGTRTVTELATDLNVARSTVTERLDLLTSIQLVEQARTTERAQARGRPAAQYAFRPSAGFLLAIQIGVAGARLAITQLDGTVRWTGHQQINLEDGPEVLVDGFGRQLSQELGSLGRGPADVWGIGVGTPSSAEFTFRGLGSRWSEQRIAATLGQHFRAPAIIEQDATLLALAEYTGLRLKPEVLLCVKVGTVIDAGVIVNGRPLSGASGLVGGIGHTRVGEADGLCTCGNRGCLDTVASGRALVAAFQAEGRSVSGIREVIDLAQAGDPSASQAIRSAGRHVGTVLAGAINLLNPEVVRIWGHLADSEDQFVVGVKESVYRHSLPAVSQVARIDVASMGADTGIRGAALAASSVALDPDAIDRRISQTLGAGV